MGKISKSKDKEKNAIFKSKYVPAKKKGVKDKSDAEQKGSKKQTKALEKEYKALAIKYQGVEGQATSMLEHISQLQLESREIKDSLALEVENTAHVRDRLDSLETSKELDQKESAALKQQVERQARLVSEARSRLEAVEQLTRQSASLREQIEYLQAGKSEMESSIGNLAKEGYALKSDSQGLGSRFEDLSSSFDDAIQRMQESAEREQVIEAWMENLNRADSDLSLQMGQQQERVQGLVERSEKLDQAAHEITVSYRMLQEQVRGFARSLVTAKEQLAGKDAELEKKSLQLDSDYQRLTARHGRLAGSVLVAGVLFLALGAVAYWAKFNYLDDRTSIAVEQIERISEQVEQIERISEQVEQHERRLAHQEQHDIAAKYVWLGENQVEMGRQLAKTQGLLAKLVTKAERRKTEIKEQEQKPRTIEDHIQSTWPQPKVESTQDTVGKVKGSAWLQGLSPRHYTLQIFADYDATVVSWTASREDLQEPMAIHKGEFNQGDWYVLLYGDYSTITEARSAIQNLPEDIRAGDPWVRNLSGIQSDLAELERK